MRPISFVDAATLPEAIAALSAGNGNARVIAGGSDLLGELKEGIATQSTLVDLSRIEGLKGIARTDASLRIGALTTIHALETAGELAGPYQMLAEAARSVATPEVRNQGTLGGNLCQRPRCLHYRSALSPCFKKGSDDCPAVESEYQQYLSVMGGDRCFAVHPTDLGPPLIAYDATVAIEGPSGRREMALESFFTGPEVDITRETVLESGEVLTSVSIPARSDGWRGVYTKGRERTAGDFAVVSVAVGFEVRDGRVRDCRIVLGGVAPSPMRSRRAEALVEGQMPSEPVAASAAEAALADAQPLSHNAHKVQIARVLIERTILRVASMA
nr:J210 [uncultured bacterium]